MNGNQTNRAAERLVQRIQRYTNISVLFSQIGEQGGGGAEVQRSGGAEEADWGTIPAPEISFGGQGSVGAGEQGGFVAQPSIQRQAVPAPVVPPPPPPPAPSVPPPTPAQPPIQRQDAPAASPAPQRPLADNPNIPWSRLQAIRQLHRQETAEPSAAPTPPAESPSVPTAAPTPEPDDTPMPWVLQRQAKEEARRKVETQGPRRVLRRSSLVEVNGPKGAGEQGGRGAEVQRSGGGEVQRGVDPEITSAMAQEVGAPALTGGEVSRSESGEIAGGAEVQRSGTESPPLPNPKSKIENPAPSRPPLEQAWPVQRAGEPATADSAAVSEPSYDPPAGTPPPREPSPEAVQAQEVMRHIAPEKSSRSSVDFVMPTRPRPAPPVQRETAVPSSSSSPSPASEPQMVNTEIGQLPSDLWGLLGDTPPVQREEAAEYSHAVVDATGGVEEQGSRRAGEMEMSVQRVEEAEGQRSGGAEGMGAAVQREGLPAADSVPSAPFMERTPSLHTSAEEQRNGGAEGMGAPVQRQDGPEVTAPTRAEEQGSGGAGEMGAPVQREEVTATTPPPSAPFTGHTPSPSASAAGDLGEAEEAVAPVQRQESPEITAPPIQAGEQGSRGAEEMGAAVQREDAPVADSAPSAPFTGDTFSPSALAEGQRSGGAEEMGAAVQRQESPEVTAPIIQAGGQGGRGAGEMGAAVQRQESPEVTTPAIQAGEMGAAVQRAEVPAADSAPSAPFMGDTPSLPALAERQRSGGAEEMGAAVQRQESPEVTAPIVEAGELGSRGDGEMGAPVQREEVPTADTAPSAPFMGDTSSPSDLAEEQRSGGAEEMGAPVQRQESPEVTAPTIQVGEQGGRGAGEIEAVVQRAEAPVATPPPSAPFTEHTSSPSALAAGEAEAQRSGGAEEMGAPVQRQETAEAVPTPDTAPTVTTQFVQRAGDLDEPDEPTGDEGLGTGGSGDTPPPPPPPPPASPDMPPSLPSDSSNTAEPAPAPSPETATPPSGDAMVDTTGGMETPTAAGPAESAPSGGVWLTAEATPTSQPVLVRPQGEASEAMLHGDSEGVAAVIAQSAPPTAQMDVLRLFRDEAKAAEQLPEAAPFLFQPQQAQEAPAISYADSAEATQFMAEAATAEQSNALALYASESEAGSEGGQLVPVILQLEGEASLHVGYANGDRLADFLPQMATQERDGIQLFATEAQADRNEVTDAETLVVQVKGAAEKYLLFASASALAGLLAQAESLNRGATIMAYADEGAAAADTSNVVQILLKQDEEETVVIGFADRQEVDVFLVQAAEWQADTTLDEIARHVYQHLQHQLVVERERRAF